MAFTNLLTAIFPVGSVYLSTTSTSPSSTIGGTWTQVKGATLAATGANSFAGGASYGGSLKISINQMPSHSHTLTWVAGTGDSGYIPLGSSSGDKIIANSGVELVGGGKTICLTIGVATFGIALHNLYSFWGGEING